MLAARLTYGRGAITDLASRGQRAGKVSPTGQDLALSVWNIVI
jgi:hypothetical protein